jgi:hypothetical protein
MTDMIIPPAPDFIQVPEVIKNPSLVVWLHSELTGRWDLVADREEQAKILGCTPALVSSRRSNYSREFPRSVVKYGAREWVLRSKIEEFAEWLEKERNAATGKNKGRKVERTVKQKAEAEILRLSRRLVQLEERRGQLAIKLREKEAEIRQTKSRIAAQENLRDTSTR